MRGDRPVRVAFILAGLHRVQRGAEVALESIARELATGGGFDVTLFGSGIERQGEPYRFVHVPCVPRERFERWPTLPPFRSEYCWEEASFAVGLLRQFKPREFDAVVTCSYPFVNWLIRLRRGRRKPPYVLFVTQNGDWPLQARNREYRFFACDGLVCTNPVYHDRNRGRRHTWIIPNAVDPQRFVGTDTLRAELGIPAADPVVLMVSALISSKRVVEGLSALGSLADVRVLVAGDGPLREQVDAQGRMLFGARYQRLTLPSAAMPALYRAANALLHMSRDEPFGNVYVEALASGIPVVAHDWRSTRWLFESQGILVDTDDAGAVRAGVQKALEDRSPVTAAARRELVNRRFTWRAVAGAYAQCLAEILSQ